MFAAIGRMKQPILSFVKRGDKSIEVVDLATPSSSEDSDYRKAVNASKRQSPRISYENGTRSLRNRNGEGSSKGASSNLAEHSKQESRKSTSDGKSNNKKKISLSLKSVSVLTHS